MKLPDTNVLIYAANRASAQHESALNWMQESFATPAGVGLAWIILLGFVRICTRRGILERPLSIDDALATINYWLNQPRARVLHPGKQHAELLGSLLTKTGTAGNLTTDAHLAALAIEHGATLGSFDSDFERFRDLSFERLRLSRLPR